MMESLAALDFLCLVAVPVLAILFVIQWIRKKPKKWVGISALICVVVIVVCTITASCLSQESVDDATIVTENDQLMSINEEETLPTLTSESEFGEEEWSEGMEAVAEMFYFHSMAELISDDITLEKISNDIMQITINLGKDDPEEIREKIEEIGPVIGKVFSQDEKITSCSSCNIVVVDGDGMRLFAYSVDSDASLTVIE